MKVLVLSPHTDDAELGCGGTICKFLEKGYDIAVAVFSSCKESVPAGFAQDILINECQNSLTSLGILEENIILFDYRVRFFNYDRQAILEDLVKLKRSFSPDLVILPSLDDYHQDHNTIAYEGVRCFKNNCSIISYELIWNNTSFKNQMYVPLDTRHLSKKMEALSKYETQRDRNYFSDDFITSLARTRGIQNGVDYAEAYEVIRYKIL